MEETMFTRWQVSLAIDNAAARLGYHSIKKKQRTAIEAFVAFFIYNNFACIEHGYTNGMMLIQVWTQCCNIGHICIKVSSIILGMV